MDGSKFSPKVIEHAVRTAGVTSSYDQAAKLLKELTGISITSRCLNNTTVMIGQELQDQRDTRSRWPVCNWMGAACRHARPVVGQAGPTRTGEKIRPRAFSGGTVTVLPVIPVPSCLGVFLAPGPCPTCWPVWMRSLKTRRRPARVSLIFPGDLLPCFGRVCAVWQTVSPLDRGWRAFFYGGGLAYHWSIQSRGFPTFTPILDFIHPLQRLHKVSRGLFDDADKAWSQSTDGMELCCQGQVSVVLAELRRWQDEVGVPLSEHVESDASVVLDETITYLSNNQSRMDYPSYRACGLRTSSCLIESLIKEMNQRVKGSEKFWNDGVEGEAILQVRAANLSDDERLHKHFQQRAGSPYTRKLRKNQTAQPDTKRLTCLHPS